MLTLTREDLISLLEAEEALKPHLPDAGLPGASRLFELFADAHRLVFEQRRTAEAEPDAEPWGLAPGRRRGDDTPGPTVEVPSHATAIRARARAEESAPSMVNGRGDEPVAPSCPPNLTALAAQLDARARAGECPAAPSGSWATDWQRLVGHETELEIWLVHPDRVPDCLRRDLSPLERAVVLLLKAAQLDPHTTSRTREIRQLLQIIRGYA